MRKQIPYCYFIGWPELNRYYYGVKFGVGANPDKFWVNYHTSSELVEQYRAKYGEPSIREIRKIFNPADYESLEVAQLAAITHEVEVIRRMKMVPDERYLNCSNALGKYRLGERVTNHTKYRTEKFDGNYHSPAGTESMRVHNKVYSKLYNPMHRPEIKIIHLDAVASKFGYLSYAEYITAVTDAFLNCKTVKGASDATGHAQYTIRHLLLDNYGKDWVDSIRKEGLADAKLRSAKSNHNRVKSPTDKALNNNAYVWAAISPTSEVTIIFGNRLEFCGKYGVSSWLGTEKSHLRKGWEFEKICRVKHYSVECLSKYPNYTIFE